MVTQSTIRDKSKIIGLLALLGVLAAPIHAHALTASEIVERYCGSNEKILVNTFDDHEDVEGCTAEDCSLREAVNAANLCVSGAPGKIQLSKGAYLLDKAIIFDETTALNIVGDVWIYGNGATTIKRSDAPGTPEFRIFSVNGDASLHLRKSLTIENGSSHSGGAINVRRGGFLSLNYVTLTRNRASSLGGGGIYSQGETRIVNSTLSENVADNGDGGAVVNWGFMKIALSTLSSNNGRGASAIFNLGRFELWTSTVSGNTSGWGPAIVNVTNSPRYLNDDVSMRIVDSTIVNNQGDGTSSFETVFPAGLYSYGNTLEITNSIIAKNAPYDCGFFPFYWYGAPWNVEGYVPQESTYSSKGTNLDNDGSCAMIPELNFTLSMDPMLEPLAYNTAQKQTHMPVWGSPVIDAGDTCKSRDQLSQERPVDGNLDSISSCDIGAVEFQPDYYLDAGPLTCAVSVGGCDDSQISTGNNPPDFGL